MKDRLSFFLGRKKKAKTTPSEPVEQKPVEEPKPEEPKTKPKP
jgi:hypothetical protein